MIITESFVCHPKVSVKAVRTVLVRHRFFGIGINLAEM
ncbi:hypothetical protein VQ7734_04728 [Vibrio quintilis]|uniref:Uncharacterized protein n=1 Tax=Vibrio quintilis TaxID=1117707 RepID=A0A1M7Z232_9VIBR|nr:hypothetical protein VQ7734_04728 [Vibrio quintilis]